MPLVDTYLCPTCGGVMLQKGPETVLCVKCKKEIIKRDAKFVPADK